MMSKGLKVVFAAFMQHCIQSNVTHLTHVERVKSVLYSVYNGLSPLPGRKAIWYLPPCEQNHRQVYKHYLSTISFAVGKNVDKIVEIMGK